MKIKLIELKKIIRKALKEQGWVPQRWNPTSGDPLDDSDIERMGSGGLGEEEKDEKASCENKNI